jgi:hypothetical protein
VRSRTAGVMTTLMRNGRDRRLEKPVKCHARKERVFLVGTRSADHIRASGHSGCIQRPDTWLHPNASLKCQIPLAPRAPSIHGTFRTSPSDPSMSVVEGKADVRFVTRIVLRGSRRRAVTDRRFSILRQHLYDRAVTAELLGAVTCHSPFNQAAQRRPAVTVARRSVSRLAGFTSLGSRYFTWSIRQAMRGTETGTCMMPAGPHCWGTMTTMAWCMAAERDPLRKSRSSGIGTAARLASADVSGAVVREAVASDSGAAKAHQRAGVARAQEWGVTAP